MEGRAPANARTGRRAKPVARSESGCRRLAATDARPAHRRGARAYGQSQPNVPAVSSA